MSNRKLIEEIRDRLMIDVNHEAGLIPIGTRAFLDKAAEALEALEWRTDMENAPEDEFHIRGVWLRSSLTGKTIFESNIGFVSDNGQFMSSNGDEFGWGIDDYTHWRPLPQPPSPQEGETDG